MWFEAMLVELFLLTLHPDNNFERYSRRKLPKNSKIISNYNRPWDF